MIVADGAHHAAPGAGIGARYQPHDHRQHHQRQDQITGPRRQQRGRDVHAIGLVILRQRRRPGNGRDGERAAGEPIHVLDQRTDDLGNADRGNGEIVGAEAKTDLADDIGDTGRQHAAEQPAQHRMGTQPPDPAATGAFDIGRCRIELAAIEHIGHEPGEHDERALPPAGNAHAMGLPRRQHDQRTGGKGQLKVDRIRFDRHHHDRRFAEPLNGFDLPAGLNTVHLRHDDVHEDQVDARGTVLAAIESEEAEGCCGRVGHEDLFVARGGENRLKQCPVVRRIVDDKNAHVSGASIEVAKLTKWQN